MILHLRQSLFVISIIASSLCNIKGRHGSLDHLVSAEEQQEAEDLSWALQDRTRCIVPAKWEFTSTRFQHRPEEYTEFTYPSSIHEAIDNMTFDFSSVQYQGCEDIECEFGEFCGKDLRCHPYNCENWYTLAHPFYTKYREGISEELDCKPVNEDGKDRTYLHLDRIPCGVDGRFPNAVYYNPWDSVDASGFKMCRASLNETRELAAIQFNRKCTAIPHKGFGFSCYDMDPSINLDTEIDNYLTNVAVRNGQGSDENGPDDENVVAVTTRMGENSTDVGRHEYVFSYSTLNIATGDHRYPPTAESSDGGLHDYLRKTMVSRMFAEPCGDFLENAFPLCPEGCDHLHFCGTDLTCHSFNCVNVYRYAPKRYTGNPSTKLESFECSADPPVEDLLCARGGWPVAIMYGWESVRIEFNGCPETELEAAPFRYNRRCHAKDFECYDMFFDDTNLLTQALEDYRNFTTERLSQEEPYFKYLSYIGAPGPTHQRTAAMFQQGLDMERVQSLMTSSYYSAAPTTTTTATSMVALNTCWPLVLSFLFVLS